MDIAVCIKQTVDTEAEVGVDAEGRALTEGQTLVIDPYSEFAVERAVQLAEEHGGDVSVVCVGGDEAVPAVRHALSMGASAGYLVDDAALAEADAAVK
ncbi:electron transfer flavoprotein subunit beta/FixA family protein, partial [Eggerthella lenta]|nr:electron transfer flavoprotein subunit beta/FixA family protein [Eggerthella lenta]